MIVTTLIAATVAAAEPAPTPQVTATPTPKAEKKMACCDKMAKGEGCACCKDMGKSDAKSGASHGEHDH
jgi:hypothetical protein